MKIYKLAWLSLIVLPVLPTSSALGQPLEQDGTIYLPVINSGKKPPLSSHPNCYLEEDATILRCSLSKSDTQWSVAEIVTGIRPPDMATVWIEARGGDGRGMNFASSGGIGGYARSALTVGDLLELSDDGDLLILVGEDGPSEGYGGAASIVSGQSLEDAQYAFQRHNDLANTRVIVIAGGGGGGGGVAFTCNGGNGGAGAVALTGTAQGASGTDGDIDCRLGGTGGGDPTGSGGAPGGKGGVDGNDDNSGADGIGGLGSRGSQSYDPDPAGWGINDSWAASWSHGEGGIHYGATVGEPGGGGGGAGGGGGGAICDNFIVTVGTGGGGGGSYTGASTGDNGTDGFLGQNKMPGNSVVITFNLTYNASIEVVKSFTSDDGTPITTAAQLTGSGFPEQCELNDYFVLRDGESLKCDLQAGSYNVTQFFPDDSVGSITCRSNGASTLATNGGTASIDLAAEDDVVCTFTNPAPDSNAAPKTVFYTSRSFTGNLGGLLGADALCNALAEDADLPGYYAAWLSDDDHSPATRFSRSTTPYLGVDGTQIAADWSTLTTCDDDECLENPIFLDETGASAVAIVWTDTLTDGTRAASSSASGTCNNWTSGSEKVAGRIGQTATTDHSWTQALSIGLNCSLPNTRLYCFQQ